MSAVPIPIANVDPLGEAVQAYIDAKRQEDLATRARVQAEERILALHPAREEGADSFEAGGYKVTVTGKVTYTCPDISALSAACAHMPAQMLPLRTKTELDATGAKWLRANEPELWARYVAPHVTVKPAKASVSVKV